MHANEREFMKRIQAQLVEIGAIHPPIDVGGYRCSSMGRAGTAQVVIGSDLALAKTNCREVGFRQPKLESFNLSPSTPTRMKTTSI